MTHEQWRSHGCYTTDPCGDIQPALLNSADIKRYVKKGCLIKRDDFDDERLKTASYEMKFLGELHYWDTKNDGTLEPRCRNICFGDAVKLPGNSITYLWMKEELLLPEYIAARFNLHISHVHKGILLGTGPMVDPGFFGSLLIPLHNLTNNYYELDGGDGIIWVEFTKLNVHDFWKSKEAKRPSDLKSFPNKKDVKDARSYLKRSGIIEKGGVQSAFRGALEQAQNAADDAREAADAAREETNKFKNYYTWGGLAALIAILVSLASVIIGGYNLVTQTTKIATDIRYQNELGGDEQSQKIDSIEKDVANLAARVDRYKEEANELRKQIDSMKKIQKADQSIAQ